MVWDDDQEDGERSNMGDFMNERINDLGNRPYDVNEIIGNPKARIGGGGVISGGGDIGGIAGGVGVDARIGGGGGGGGDEDGGLCYRCSIPLSGGSSRGEGSIVNEETSTGYADDANFDVELDHLNKKIEHYVLGRKTSPMMNEYKEIEESEKESEWNNVRDYSGNPNGGKGGSGGRWWEKQMFPDREQQPLPEPDGNERGYKYGGITGTPPSFRDIANHPPPASYANGDYNDLYDFSLINRAINGFV